MTNLKGDETTEDTPVSAEVGVRSSRVKRLFKSRRFIAVLVVSVGLVTVAITHTLTGREGASDKESNEVVQYTEETPTGIKTVDDLREAAEEIGRLGKSGSGQLGSLDDYSE